MIEYLDSDSFSIQYASPAFILITCHPSQLLQIFGHIAHGLFFAIVKCFIPVFPSVLFFNLKSALIITFILCRLYFAIKTTNGGRLQIKSYSSGTTFNTKTRYYSGRTLTRGFTFQFDYDPPHHCLTACSAKMLDVPAYTKEVLSDIFVTFVLSILEELFSYC